MPYQSLVIFCVLCYVAGTQSTLSTNDAVGVVKRKQHNPPASDCQKPCYEKPCAEHNEGTFVEIPAFVSLKRKDLTAEWAPELMLKDADGNLGYRIRFTTFFGNIVLNMSSVSEAGKTIDVAIVPRYLHSPDHWLHFNISKCTRGLCISLCRSLTYHLLSFSRNMSKVTVSGIDSFGYTPPDALKKTMGARHLLLTPVLYQVTTQHTNGLLTGIPLENSTSHTYVRIMLGVVTSLMVFVLIFSIVILYMILRRK